MPFLPTQVRRHHGVPTLHRAGQPIHGMTATSTAFTDPKVIAGFVDAGVEVMMIWIEVPLQCWVGPDQYDWTYAEKTLARFEEHSGDTSWIIRVRLGLMAGWFGKEHPGEVHQVQPANPGIPLGLSVGVIHSSIWLAEIQKLLTAFVTWVRGTRWASRISGFMLNAGSTEEWLPFDTNELFNGTYHPVYQREFRAWLRTAYADDEQRLQAAWARDEVMVEHGQVVPQQPPTFATAGCPTGQLRKGSHIWGPYSLRDPREDRASIDYYRFMGETLAEALITCCRTVKEAAIEPVVVGGFHSYLWWESGVYGYIQEYGHGLIQRLNDSPWIDFVSDITSYDCRYPGGPSGYLGVPQSLNLHGKLHYTEVDLVTTTSLPAEFRAAWAAADTSAVPLRTAGGIIPERVWNWSSLYCGRDHDEQCAIFRREHLRNLISGSAYWWFDIRGRDYVHPDFVRELAALSQIGKRAMAWDRSSACQVAFVLSESTPPFQAAMNGSLVRFELEAYHGLLLDVANRQWGLCGTPFDIYEVEDLAVDNFPGEQYRLLVFVNCANLTAKAQAGVQRWQGGGRTLAWTYAAAVIDEAGIVPSAGEAFTGTRLGWRCERQQIRVVMEPLAHPLLAGGAALDFGTEGSVGPVFFADDPQATVLGRLRDGGEPAFTLRQHDGWNAIYLAMLNCGPDLLRNLMRFSGAHIYSASDDAVYACRSLVAMHTNTGGAKTLQLPQRSRITDLFNPGTPPTVDDRIRFEAAPRRTYAWHIEPA